MSEIILKVALMDIARELNITAATVSSAFNDHPAIINSTKNTVKIIADKLH
jgi:DNA-binding LacI/PurR family transcriptional regulator